IRSSISARVKARSGIAPCGCDRNARSWSAVVPLRAIARKVGGPCGTPPLGLLLITWQLAHHCRASCAPLATSAQAACAATRPSINSASMAGRALYDTVVLLAVFGDAAA